MLDEGACTFSECTDDQIPDQDNCHPQDGYKRTKLFRAWETSCPPIQANLTDKFFYVWEHHGNWHWGSKAVLKCLPGYQIPPAWQDFDQSTTNETFPDFNFDENSQTLTCMFDDRLGGIWPQTIVACEPLVCKKRPPKVPDQAFYEVIYSPNTTTHRQYETKWTYYCPKNTSLPDLIKDEFTFGYSVEAGIIQEVNATCELDG